MFNPSIQKFVDSYINRNDEFRRFCRDVSLEHDNDTTIKIIVNGKSVYETTRDLYLALSAPLINAIGSTTRRRYFVWYHHLIKEGVNLY